MQLGVVRCSALTYVCPCLRVCSCLLLLAPTIASLTTHTQLTQPTSPPSQQTGAGAYINTPAQRGGWSQQGGSGYYKNNRQQQQQQQVRLVVWWIDASLDS